MKYAAGRTPEAKAKRLTEISAVKRWRWQRVFAAIVRRDGDASFGERHEHAVDMRNDTWDRFCDAKDDFERDNFRLVMEDVQAFARLDEKREAWLHWVKEVDIQRLKVLGFDLFAAWACRRAKSRVRAPKRAAPRLTTAQRIAAHRIALPNYLAATAPTAYTKPVEEIRSVRCGNLPLAKGAKQCAELFKVLRDFAQRHGATLAESKKGDGNVFCPLRNGQTVGYGFIKCASAASAQLLLERIGALSSPPAIVDPVTGDERELLVELAASEHKSKEQMEREKAEKARAKDSVSAESARIVALMKADKAKPSTTLQPVNLGAAAKVARQEEVDAAARAMQARIAAMFPTALGEVVEHAPKAYAVSFATMAAKPAVKPVETIVDPFNVMINGEKWGIYHDPSTELGMAQRALRQRMEEEEMKPVLEAQRKRRAARRKRNAAQPADAWGGEPDTDDEDDVMPRIAYPARVFDPATLIK